MKGQLVYGNRQVWRNVDKWTRYFVAEASFEDTKYIPMILRVSNMRGYCTNLGDDLHVDIVLLSKPVVTR